MDKLLMIPGPTMLSAAVMNALGTQMKAHRTDEYGSFLHQIQEDSKKVFQTKSDLHIISGSSTAGMDASISSWISPGDKVIVPVYGKFSARFRQIVRVYQGEVVELQLPWGQAPISRQIESLYTDDVKAVAIVQNETSTGVRVDLAQIGSFLADTDTLFIVDAVSSMGGDDIPTDRCKVDICVAGSQKAFGCPPGLALVSVSQKAWDIMESTEPRSFYLDLRKYRAADKKNRGQTPFTQSESLLFALRAALDEIMAEGLRKRFERHIAMARLARSRAQSLGFKFFPFLENTCSNTLTALKIPKPLRATDIQGAMDRDHDVVVAAGHDEYREKMIRIAHLGSTSLEDVARTMDAFEDVVKRLRS